MSILLLLRMIAHHRPEERAGKVTLQRNPRYTVQMFFCC